ncbi:hypothetical protein LTR96_011845, partial [Exophiala xenobiotica]
EELLGFAKQARVQGQSKTGGARTEDGWKVRAQELQDVVEQDGVSIKKQYVVHPSSAREPVRGEEPGKEGLLVESVREGGEEAAGDIN